MEDGGRSVDGESIGRKWNHPARIAARDVVGDPSGAVLRVGRNRDRRGERLFRLGRPIRTSRSTAGQSREREVARGGSQGLERVSPIALGTRAIVTGNQDVIAAGGDCLRRCENDPAGDEQCRREEAKPARVACRHYRGVGGFEQNQPSGPEWIGQGTLRSAPPAVEACAGHSYNHLVWEEPCFPRCGACLRSDHPPDETRGSSGASERFRPPWAPG